MRGPSGRGASRLTRAGVLESTSSTASKRNEVMAVLSRASPVSGEKGRSVIDLPSPRTWERGHPCPHGGGDITPIRLRRSLFFVAPATPAGTPSCRQPGESVKALPGRPGRAGCGRAGAPKLLKAAAPAAQLLLACAHSRGIARQFCCPVTASLPTTLPTIACSLLPTIARHWSALVG